MRTARRVRIQCRPSDANTSNKRLVMTGYADMSKKKESKQVGGSRMLRYDVGRI